jgi:hypothetical protein
MNRGQVPSVIEHKNNCNLPWACEGRFVICSKIWFSSEFREIEESDLNSSRLERVYLG